MIMIAILLIPLVFTFTEDVTLELQKNESDYPKGLDTLINLMPFATIFGILIVGIIFMFSAVDQVTYEDDEEIVVRVSRIEAIKLRKDAEAVLRMRYAKGEIDSIEFSERMSRL